MNTPEDRLKKKWRQFKAGRAVKRACFHSARMRQDMHAGVHVSPACAWWGRLRFHTRMPPRVRHVTSTWAVIIQAGIGSASIRAVRHMAETHVRVHASPLAHARPEFEEGLSASRSTTSDSKKHETGRAELLVSTHGGVERTRSWWIGNLGGPRLGVPE